ncbi:hypothetical protein [Herbaspirillum huttiense]|uniref:Uncharacterized protein n=1 Tax=Herbaspirillum huttiense subsp. lycopersici TaxID=3074428 RepID=A0ABU2EG05_9BURK|nr:hypothetical protein [Herbaspirillum huttiense]MDR9847056.1 hypothetical protein [Herbaspirillum huttiense SE1]
MALSKLEREALRRARMLLDRLEVVTICYALTRVARGSIPHAEACMRLKLYVQNALGGQNTTLGSWQRQHGIRHDFIKQREDRIAWIDWMLDQPEIES